MAATPAEQGGAQRNLVPLAVFAGAAVLVFGALYWFISDLLASEAKPTQQTVAIQVIKPPPPPPPKIEEEPPPPPEVEEEVELPEPEPLPDVPDLPDAPPADQLGLDAEGVAGSDAFGLAANRGGRGLIGGEGAFRWYAQKLKDQVSDYLASQPAVLNADYRVRLLLWVNGDGTVAKVRLGTSTGDAALDATLRSTLKDLKRLKQRPPNGLPQPIAIRVVGHA